MKNRLSVKKYGIALGLLLGFVLALPASAEPKVKTVRGTSKQLTLSVGISKTLQFDFDIGPIQLTEGILSYRRIKVNGRDRNLLIIPKTPGYTDMTVYDAGGKPRLTYLVRVTREDTGSVISQLSEMLGDIEGIQVKAIGGTIVIDGEILLPKDMQRIIRVVEALKDRDAKGKTVPIRNLATISKITMKIIAERIEREVNSPEISVRVLNNNLMLEGTASSDFEADRAVEIAKTYLPDVFVARSKGEGGEVKPKKDGGLGGLPAIIDLLRIAPPSAAPPANDIKVTMNYVELLNEYGKTFKFNWSPLASESGSIGYNSGTGGITASLVATISSLFPKLTTAKEHAHARILKQEQIIVKDGASQPAAIESAVDFYVRNVAENGSVSVQPVSVQNVLKVRAATIPGSDSIELGIQITLNSLVGTNQGNPVIAKNSLQTQVTIKNGDSAALGGYAIDSSLSGYNRSPTSSLGGGDGNGGGGTALFNLNRSKEYKHDKQQYVIFVTPEVLRTASAGTEDITRKFRLNAGEN